VSAETAFALGMAAGALLAFVVLLVAQAAQKEQAGAVAGRAFDAEDKAQAATRAQLEAARAKRDQAHAAIDQLAPEEIDRVLNGSATLDDIMRERAAKQPTR